MGSVAGGNHVRYAKAPLSADTIKDAKNEFAELRRSLGWKDEEQYILMNRQVMYTGTRDEIIANYDNFIQKNILGEQNADISMPLGIYNHYFDYLSNAISESFNQLEHTNPYNDDFSLQKTCTDGINQWLCVAFFNCRSGKEKNEHFVRFMFQVAIYTRTDKKAQKKLAEIAENAAQHNQNEDDNKQNEAYKIEIPQPLNDEQLALFQRKFREYIAEYGWAKEEVFIHPVDRQVLHIGSRDDIVPDYVDFFEKVVFGDKKSAHSMPTGVYNHYLVALTNTIENSLGQVSYEEVNEYKDTFKLQQRVDDGEREWYCMHLTYTHK